jgi:hypothetical protein
MDDRQQNWNEANFLECATLCVCTVRLEMIAEDRGNVNREKNRSRNAIRRAVRRRSDRGGGRGPGVKAAFYPFASGSPSDDYGNQSRYQRGVCGVCR